MAQVLWGAADCCFLLLVLNIGCGTWRLLSAAAAVWLQHVAAALRSACSSCYYAEPAVCSGGVLQRRLAADLYICNHIIHVKADKSDFCVFAAAGQNSKGSVFTPGDTMSSGSPAFG